MKRRSKRDLKTISPRCGTRVSPRRNQGGRAPRSDSDILPRRENSSTNECITYLLTPCTIVQPVTNISKLLFETEVIVQKNNNAFDNQPKKGEAFFINFNETSVQQKNSRTKGEAFFVNFNDSSVKQETHPRKSGAFASNSNEEKIALPKKGKPFVIATNEESTQQKKNPKNEDKIQQKMLPKKDEAFVIASSEEIIQQKKLPKKDEALVIASNEEIIQQKKLPKKDEALVIESNEEIIQQKMLPKKGEAFVLASSEEIIQQKKLPKKGEAFVFNFNEDKIQQKMLPKKGGAFVVNAKDENNGLKNDSKNVKTFNIDSHKRNDQRKNDLKKGEASFNEESIRQENVPKVDEAFGVKSQKESIYQGHGPTKGEALGTNCNVEIVHHDNDCRRGIRPAKLNQNEFPFPIKSVIHRRHRPADVLKISSEESATHYHAPDPDELKRIEDEFAMYLKKDPARERKLTRKTEANMIYMNARVADNVPAQTSHEELRKYENPKQTAHVFEPKPQFEPKPTFEPKPPFELKPPFEPKPSFETKPPLEPKSSFETKPLYADNTDVSMYSAQPQYTASNSTNMPLPRYQPSHVENLGVVRRVPETSSVLSTTRAVSRRMPQPVHGMYMPIHEPAYIDNFDMLRPRPNPAYAENFDMLRPRPNSVYADNCDMLRQGPIPAYAENFDMLRPRPNPAYAENFDMLRPRPNPVYADNFDMLRPRPNPAYADNFDMLRPRPNPAYAENFDMLRPRHNPAYVDNFDMLRQGPNPAYAENFDMLRPRHNPTYADNGKINKIEMHFHMNGNSASSGGDTSSKPIGVHIHGMNNHEPNNMPISVFVQNGDTTNPEQKLVHTENDQKSLKVIDQVSLDVNSGNIATDTHELEHTLIEGDTNNQILPATSKQLHESIVDINQAETNPNGEIIDVTVAETNPVCNDNADINKPDVKHETEMTGAANVDSTKLDVKLFDEIVVGPKPNHKPLCFDDIPLPKPKFHDANMDKFDVNIPPPELSRLENAELNKSPDSVSACREEVDVGRQEINPLWEDPDKSVGIDDKFITPLPMVTDNEIIKDTKESDSCKEVGSKRNPSVENITVSCCLPLFLSALQRVRQSRGRAKPTNIPKPRDSPGNITPRDGERFDVSEKNSKMLIDRRRSKHEVKDSDCRTNVLKPTKNRLKREMEIATLKEEFEKSCGMTKTTKPDGIRNMSRVGTNGNDVDESRHRSQVYDTGNEVISKIDNKKSDRTFSPRNRLPVQPKANNVETKLSCRKEDGKETDRSNVLPPPTKPKRNGKPAGYRWRNVKSKVDDGRNNITTQSNNVAKAGRFNVGARKQTAKSTALPSISDARKNLNRSKVDTGRNARIGTDKKSDRLHLPKIDGQCNGVSATRHKSGPSLNGLSSRFDIPTVKTKVATCARLPELPKRAEPTRWPVAMGNDHTGNTFDETPVGSNNFKIPEIPPFKGGRHRTGIGDKACETSDTRTKDEIGKPKDEAMFISFSPSPPQRPRDSRDRGKQCASSNRNRPLSRGINELPVRAGNSTLPTSGSKNAESLWISFSPTPPRAPPPRFQRRRQTSAKVTGQRA